MPASLKTLDTRKLKKFHCILNKNWFTQTIHWSKLFPSSSKWTLGESGLDVPRELKPESRLGRLSPSWRCRSARIWARVSSRAGRLRLGGLVRAEVGEGRLGRTGEERLGRSEGGEGRLDLLVLDLGLAPVCNIWVRLLLRRWEEEEEEEAGGGGGGAGRRLSLSWRLPSRCAFPPVRGDACPCPLLSPEGISMTSGRGWPAL